MEYVDDDNDDDSMNHNDEMGYFVCVSLAAILRSMVV